jgi:hypothetical protein
MANEKETKTIIGEVKETLTEAKKKMENVVGEVKDAVVDAAKETANVVTETVENVTEVKGDGPAPLATKKATWWNRIWSAIVGALIAVGSMFGITTEQVAEQKAKTEEVRKLAGEALELAKAGKLDDAKATLEKAVETGKEVVADAKEVVDNVKNADKEAVKETVKKSLIETVKETITKSDVKKAEQAAAQYTDEVKK